MCIKKALIVLILIASTCFSQDMSKLKVIMVGIGGMNPTLDHGKYPHLKFYYTPELKSQAQLNATEKSALSLFGGMKSSREIFKGEPKILADWWDEIDLRGHAILFDKNGVGFWQGWVDRLDDIFDSRGYGEEKELGDALEAIFDDGETADFDDDKEFEADEDDNLIERKMVDFIVVGKDEKPISVASIIEPGKPTLIVFFSLPLDIDITAAAKEEKRNDSFLGSLTQTVVGFEYEKLFQKVEALFDK
ncbi:MAG: hypothetical protein Fur0015_00550 [Ignavibacteriales bacterium]